MRKINPNHALLNKNLKLSVIPHCMLNMQNNSI